MSNRNSLPIGMFDSGVGGLTVLKEIVRLLPTESIIYFGDTARIPYGDKSRETIIRYSIENASFLMQKGIKLLVVPCNTASAFAINHLQSMLDIPVIGVIEPGAKTIASVTKSQRVAVLGTKGTIQSGAYQAAIREYLPHASIFPVPCPLFVPLVEEQFLNHPATHLIVKEYLSSLHKQNIDSILLGCTHYPFLKPLIQEEMGPTTTLIDPALSCAQQVALTLDMYQLTSNSLNPPDYMYYVSDDPEKFQKSMKTLFSLSTQNIEMANLSPVFHEPLAFTSSS